MRASRSGLLLFTMLVVSAAAACGEDGDGPAFLRGRGEPSPTARVLEGGGAEGTVVPTRPNDSVGREEAAEGALLPDLQTDSFRELFVEVRSDGARTLRFSTTVVNTGDGPLELSGGFDESTQEVVTNQRVYQPDGSVQETEVGRFVYHPAHEHWHFEDFTVLEVWTEDDDGDLDEMVATTGKATFCAVDEVAVSEAAPPPAYLACGEEIQGISAGWSDTYGAEISGQAVDLGTLPDGAYAIRSTVDPANRLLETNDDNNSTIARVDLRGDEIVLRGVRSPGR